MCNLVIGHWHDYAINIKDVCDVHQSEYAEQSKLL